jgi:tripartite-type tricarboxylate transporter receptor subunit TctC
MKTILAAAVASLAALVSSSLHAQGYPSRAITMIVPQAAGGTNDIVGRVVSAKLAEVLGGTVVVENRVGAGDNVGTQAAAKAPRDGYTLLMTISSSQAINPALYKEPGFDPVKDFRPIALVGAVPNVLLANPSFPAKTVAELLAMAKAKPGELQYASAGNGTLNHLLGAMLATMGGVEIQHVPYKGVAPAMNDVMGGQLPLVFASLPSAIGQIKAGKLRALAVTSPTRSPIAPDVPTMVESGFDTFKVTTWYGVWAIKGTPKEIVDRMHAELVKAMALPDVKGIWDMQGATAGGQSPADFAKFIRGEIETWGKVVKQANLKIDL